MDHAVLLNPFFHKMACIITSLNMSETSNGQGLMDSADWHTCVYKT